MALDGQFGEPLDAYVNGSQVWLREDGPDGMTIEWRLHPVARYKRPAGMGTYDVFARTALLAAHGEAIELLWDGLEAFPAYGDDIEPAPLQAVVTAALGITPDAFGLVDHEPIADAWERSKGTTSIVDALLAQLHPS